MENPIQSTDSKEGSSVSYRNTRRDKLELVSTPFSPIFEVPEQEDPADEPEPQKIKFVQAYIINYLATPADYIYIEDMDEAFDIDKAAVGEEEFERIYEVAIELDELSLYIKSAKFQKKPIEGEEGYRDPEEEINIYNANTTVPQKDCVKIYLPVCQFIDDTLTDIWFRDNIHWWGDLLGGCAMWAPKLIDEREPTAQEPNWMLYFGQGTINGFISEPDDFGTNIPVEDLEKVFYLLLHVDIVDNQVSLAWQELVDFAGLADKELDPVNLNNVPTHIDIILGVVANGRVCMYFNSGIVLEPYVWLQKTIEGEYKYGTRPFDEYLKLKPVSL
jgi:hypothetical protein